MAGWETLVAAIGGLLLGLGGAAIESRRRARRSMRRAMELEARVRRSVVPVLERRADVLGVPPSERGADTDGPIELAITLAQSIRLVEESSELPFGDTVEVSRRELKDELARKSGP